MTKLATTVALSLLLSIAFVFGSISHAQSGRRAAKPASPAVPTPTPEPTPTPRATPAPKAPFTVFVGIDGNGAFQHFPAPFYTAVLDNFSKELSQDVKVDVINDGDMTRGEANKKAKEEKESYVVYMQLELETMNPSARSEDARDAILSYILMAPITTKVVASGRIYAASFQNRGITRRPSSGLYDDYMLEEAAKAAGREVAEYFKRHGSTPLN